MRNKNLICRFSLILCAVIITMAFTGCKPKVYIAGIINSDKSCYWVNGKQTYFPGTDFVPLSIAVSSGKVYAAGFSQSDGNACYFADGVKTDLTAGTNSFALSIAVSDSKVYVSGYYAIGNKEQACYWVNGAKIDLPEGNIAYSIFVSGGKVYVAGVYGGATKACYWVDGVKTNLTIGISSVAKSIIVSNNKIYIAGFFM
jgi:hypothetical protein